MASSNIWDRAAHFAIRQDRPAFYEWTLKLPRGEPYFIGWADTRNVPFPPDPDRTWDTVARLDNREKGGDPWAGITQPDSLKRGRFHVCGGSF